MKQSETFAMGLFLALPATLLLLGSKAPSPTPSSPADSRIQRGEYLVRFGGCNDCHTPMKLGPKGPEPDMTRMLSGHPEGVQLPPPPAPGQSPWAVTTAGLSAWSGPWGISYAANLTPDRNTGLGIWTEDMFLQAMRTGKHYGVSRDILPPMPWQAVASLADDDIKAIYAYLRSIPPIVNHVPDPIPPTGPLE